MIKKSRRHSGFTLIEILVSIAIFAVIATGLASTMSQMNKLTAKLRIKEATVMSGQIALDRITRDFQMAFSERVQRSTTLFKATDVGTGPEIIFSYLDSDLKTLFERRTSGVQVARYSVEKAEDGTLTIFRSSVPLYAVDKIKNQPSSILATGVTEWKMEFYDIKNDLWQTTWDTDNPATVGAFPKAVRVSIQTVNPSLPKDQWKDRALNLNTEFLVLNETEVSL